MSSSLPPELLDTMPSGLKSQGKGGGLPSDLLETMPSGMRPAHEATTKADLDQVRGALSDIESHFVLPRAARRLLGGFVAGAGLPPPPSPVDEVVGVWEQKLNDATMQRTTQNQLPPGFLRDGYWGHLREKAQPLLQEALESEAAKDSGFEQHLQQVGGYLGVATSFLGLHTASSAATSGLSRLLLRKALPKTLERTIAHTGTAAGWAGFQMAQGPDPEAVQRIDALGLQGEEREKALDAATWMRGVRALIDYPAFLFGYRVVGGIGRAAGQAAAGTAGGLVGQAAAAGLATPAIAEDTQTVTDRMLESVLPPERIQQLRNLHLVNNPNAPHLTRDLAEAFQSGDWRQIREAGRAYLGAAAPAMTAFGLLHLMQQGVGSLTRYSDRKAFEKFVDGLGRKAEKEMEAQAPGFEHEIKRNVRQMQVDILRTQEPTPFERDAAARGIRLMPEETPLRQQAEALGAWADKAAAGQWELGKVTPEAIEGMRAFARRLGAGDIQSDGMQAAIAALTSGALGEAAMRLRGNDAALDLLIRDFVAMAEGKPPVPRERLPVPERPGEPAAEGPSQAALPAPESSEEPFFTGEIREHFNQVGYEFEVPEDLLPLGEPGKSGHSMNNPFVHRSMSGKREDPAAVIGGLLGEKPDWKRLRTLANEVASENDVLDPLQDLDARRPSAPPRHAAVHDAILEDAWTRARRALPHLQETDAAVQAYQRGELTLLLEQLSAADLWEIAAHIRRTAMRMLPKAPNDVQRELGMTYGGVSSSVFSAWRDLIEAREKAASRPPEARETHAYGGIPIPEPIREAVGKAIDLGSAQVRTGSLARYGRRVGSRIAKMGPAGEEVSKGMQDIVTRGLPRSGAQHVEYRRLVKGLTPDQKKQAARIADRQLDDALAKREKGEELTPTEQALIDAPENVKRAGYALRDLLDQNKRELLTMGMRTGMTGRAFPSKLTKEGRKVLLGDGSAKMRKARQMVAEGRAADVQDALEQLVGFEGDPIRNVFGYFEKARRGVPDEFREWDPDKVVPEHLERSGMFVEAVREWGPKFERLEARLERIRNESSPAHAEQVREYIQGQFGMGRKVAREDSALHGGLSKYLTFRTLAFKVFSVLRNAQQVVTNNPDVPIRTLAQSYREIPPVVVAFRDAWLKLFGNEPFGQKVAQRIESKLDELRRSGALGETTLTEPEGTAGKVMEKGMAPFSAQELANQARQAVVARVQVIRDMERLAELAGRGESKLLRVLRALGGNFTSEQSTIERRLARFTGKDKEELARKLQTGARLTVPEVEAAMVLMVQDRQFRMTLSSKPELWDSSLLFRVIAKFKWFSLRQWGNIWKRTIFAEAAKGNFAPLLRAAMVAILFNEVYWTLRDLIEGTETGLVAPLARGRKLSAMDVAKRLARDIAEGGGLFVADLTFGISDWLIGPLAGTIENAARAGQDILQGQPVADVLPDFLRREIGAINQVDRWARGIAGGDELRAYYLWRGKAYDFLDAKELEDAADEEGTKGAVLEGLRQFLGSRPTFERGKNTLNYERAAKALAGGDVDAAASALVEPIRRALKKDAGDIRPAITGVKNGMRGRAPLGPIPRKSIDEFLEAQAPADRDAAMAAQDRFLGLFAEAFDKAYGLAEGKQ